jgi:hypothetical protein
MARLPALSGREAVAMFESAAGWWLGSRQFISVLVHPDHAVTLSVPDHKGVAKGTFRSLIRSANLTSAEFVAGR